MRFIVPAAMLGLGLAAAALLPTDGTAAESKRTTPKAVPHASNLKANVKPKKGVIFIHTKRFTSCTDWGKDKGWCAKHNK